jgi:hypothetical protein
VRALNVMGRIALVALTFYLGWVLVHGDEVREAPLVMPRAATLGGR